EFITKLRPVTYYWNYDKLNKFKGIKEKNTLPKKLETGFMAQEVEQAAKDINYDFSAVNIPDNKDVNTYTLKYAEFVVPLVQAVKELDEKNKMLEQEIKELKKLILEKVK
ncbi:MAG: tail fiber domain-containing protein, partial [Flavobacterium sp.]